jgi:hypothetical protein
MEPKVKEKKITQLSQVCESTVEYTYDEIIQILSEPEWTSPQTLI